jgi:hypothetical protein
VPRERMQSALSAAVEQFRKQHAQQFVMWVKKLTDADIEVYSFLVAQHGTVRKGDVVSLLGDTAANHALSSLCQSGVAKRHATLDERYRFAGNLFRDWFSAEVRHTVKPSGMDRVIWTKLNAISPDLGNKYVSAWAIHCNALSNYSGCVGEMRDIITAILHYFAPDEFVVKSAGYRAETGEGGVPLKGPTRRQRAAYIAKTRTDQTGSEVESQFELFEVLAKQLGKTVAQSYALASKRTHTIASREQAWKCLKQMDAILAQLL